MDGDYTGTGHMVKRVVEQLLGWPDGPELHLVHMQQGGDPLYARAAGEHVFSTPTRALWWRSQDRFCRKLSRELDVVHEPFMGLASKMECPQVVNFHDVVPLTNPELSGRTFSIYFKRVMPKVLAAADAVLCNSASTRDDMMRHYRVDPGKVHVVHHGVDPPEVDRRGTYDHLRPYMMAISNTRMKNVGHTIREFASYKEARGGDLRLVVVGTDFSGLSEGRPDVEVTGYMERGALMELMAGAEALLFPSHHEGFGYPPLEAMSLGVPTVVSDRGALPEVVGDAGLVVDIGRDGDLAAAIHRLRTEEGLAEELRRRGDRRWRDFTWADCAEGYYRVYRDLVG
jgi:glycosyltransferase involved in cell wall biosynthesis